MFLNILISLFIVKCSKEKTKIQDNSSNKMKIKSNYNNIKNNSKRNLQNTAFKPIRIVIETSQLENSLALLNYNDIGIILNSINRAKEAIQAIINVEPFSEKIKLDNYDRNNLTGFELSKLNQTILYGYNDCDLLIFVRTPISTDGPISSDYYRFAIPKIIKKDPSSKRPIVGYIIYSQSFQFKIDSIIYPEHKKEVISSIFLHEIIHLLGFMKESFNDFKNPNIFDTVNINRIPGGMIKKVVKSENIINLAKKYFNCENISGIELENQNNPEDLEFSHWEGRILLGDIMTSDIYYQDQVISEFTLAFLEESGWYKANYYTGGLMKFGKNKGCNFLNEDCIKYSQLVIEGQEVFLYLNPFSNDFCPASGTEGGNCSPGRLSRGYCDNSNTVGDPDYARYSLNSMGKKNVEYCPVSIESKIHIVGEEKFYLYNGNCKIGNDEFGIEMFFNNSDKTGGYNYTIFSKTYGGKYGKNSFCALSSVLYNNETSSKISIYGKQIRPTCYPMFCSEKSLTIQINDIYVVCPQTGGIIEIGGNYTGYIFCPDYNSICTGTEICNNIFDCIEIGSKNKDMNYTYNYTPYTLTSSLTRQNNKEDTYKNNIIVGFELSEDGKCPFECIQCYKNKRCFKCRDYGEDPPNYIGFNESDNRPIICQKEAPTEKYYQSPSKPHYYYKCIDNCLKCENQYECKNCELTHYIEKDKCVPRIVGCKDYNENLIIDEPRNGENGKGYKECLNCNNSDDYYCIDGIKTECHIIKDYNNETYYKMEKKEYPCIRKCSDQFYNCIKCNSTKCLECKNDAEYYINNFGHCIKKIDNCEQQNLLVNHSECLECKNDYYCISNKKNECSRVDNILFYYNITNNIPCIERCNNTFNNCLICNELKCLDCYEGYFIYEGKCIKNITGCIDNFYNGTYKECNHCNEIDNYYCIDENKTYCEKIKDNDIKSYYLFPNINYPCYKSCETLIEHCLFCNQTHCYNCTKEYIVNNNQTYCLLRPFNIPDNDNCTIRIHDYNKSIYDLDIYDFVDYYWEKNIPYVKVVDHFIGNNYTVTIFMNSDCTEELLDQKYFKINSNELQETMIKESNIEGMKLLFSIFINYNFKNHFRYHDIESRFLNPYKRCISCLDLNYTITNYFYNSINKVLGPIVVKLLVSEKIDIIEKDSKVFKDICNNVTFYGIDLPLKKRLKYLYLHKYSEPILCNAENCTIEEYNYDELTSTCKCNFGNSFEDILVGEKFEFIHYEGEEVKSNDFAESFGIIKCVSNGFHSKNIKANIGFFLCIIAIVAQIFLYIYYTICSKPITNIIKNTYNPPKKSSLLLITDWERNLRNLNNINEHEIYVQPRDDAEDQLLEEEKSYNNEDIFNTSSVSIDTNVGGVNIKKGPDKLILKEKVDNKKVLILLGKNKNKNRDKDKDQLITEDLKSDSDIIPLQEGKDNKLNFCKIYWSVVSLKQHMINYFSNINCCKITESYIPIPIRVIRSIFIFILSFVFNILFLNHTYYENKFEYFNEKYTFIHSEVEEQTIPISQKIIYAISNTFGKAMISFALLIVVQFFIGFIFFSIRNNVIKTKRKNNLDGIQDLVLKTKLKYLIFFIIDIVLMIIFFLSITGFGGAYGGGFVDYFVAGTISLTFLEIFPFIWSLVIALLRYIGFKKNNKTLFKISEFFMF